MVNRSELVRSRHCPCNQTNNRVELTVHLFFLYPGHIYRCQFTRPVVFIVFLRPFQFQGSPCLLKPILSHSIASIVGTIVFLKTWIFKWKKNSFLRLRARLLKCSLRYHPLYIYWVQFTGYLRLPTKISLEHVNLKGHSSDVGNLHWFRNSKIRRRLEVIFNMLYFNIKYFLQIFYTFYKNFTFGS